MNFGHFQFVYTVKPELTATSEERTPVNNGQYNLVTASINLTFIIAPLSNGHFFRPREWPLHTGLTVHKTTWSIPNLT